MKLGDLVKYNPTSWAAYEKSLINKVGVISDKSGRLWGVQWISPAQLQYHLEQDLKVMNASR